MISFPRIPLLAILAAVALASACADVSSPTHQLTPGGSSRSGGSGSGGGKGSGGGGGGGGGGDTVSGVSLLPTTPPAPGILIRESFGFANGQRPAGDRGSLKGVFVHASLGGFWLEYPGTKSTQWLASGAGQSWNFAACSADPYELPSPLQPAGVSGGCVISDWSDLPASYPTALMPITVPLPTGGYELSMEGYPARIPGGYIAIGFTSSSALSSNLTTSGSLWLRVTDTTRFGSPLHYELRTGSLTSGQVLVSGDAGAVGWNHMALRFSPTLGAVTLSFGENVIGTYPVSMSAPRYIAFEGIGVLDNLVLRQ
jgi:hypothetical protein